MITEKEGKALKHKVFSLFVEVEKEVFYWAKDISLEIDPGIDVATVTFFCKNEAYYFLFRQWLLGDPLPNRYRRYESFVRELVYKKEENRRHLREGLDKLLFSKFKRVVFEIKRGEDMAETLVRNKKARAVKRLLGRGFKLGSFLVGGSRLDCFGMVREYMYSLGTEIPLTGDNGGSLEVKIGRNNVASVTLGRYKAQYEDCPKAVMDAFAKLLSGFFAKAPGGGIYSEGDILLYYIKGSDIPSIGIYAGGSNVMICTKEKGVHLLFLSRDLDVKTVFKSSDVVSGV